MTGAEGTEYEGEKFELLFKFNNKYPFDSPEVTFVGELLRNGDHRHNTAGNNGESLIAILTESVTVCLCTYIHSRLKFCF